MGSSPRAHLAYGFDLGDSNEIRIHERDEYGSPTVDWWVSDDDLDDDAEEADDDEMSFTTQVYRRLFEAMPDPPDVEYSHQRERYVKNHYGVELVFSGSEDCEGYILAAADSERSVDWSETMRLDLTELTGRPASVGWDVHLATALAVLGFTPIQDRPAWLVYPSYG